MHVLFQSGRLAESPRTEREAVREWGLEVGPRYGQRIALLAQAERVQDLHAITSLRGERWRQHALTITGHWRPILTIQDEKTVVVEEVSHHYDD